MCMFLKLILYLSLDDIAIGNNILRNIYDLKRHSVAALLRNLINFITCYT